MIAFRYPKWYAKQGLLNLIFNQPVVLCSSRDWLLQISQNLNFTSSVVYNVLSGKAFSPS